ncbi:MAG: flagellar hook-associated protein FlgK [Planctomycetes bacterium]|nr:flagellar hook-associated protein FlgK [Planctomycetota bacterium]
MSLGFGFGSGLRALAAARLGMQTAGNNIANANTVGYSRQRLELSASLPYQTGSGFQIGSGVEIGGIFGVVDEGLQRRIQLQMGLVGSAEVDHLRFNEIEGILSEPDGGLSETFQNLFGAIGSLQTDPADRALRGGVLQAGSALSQGFRLMSSRFEELAGSTFDEVRGLVRKVNEHAASIAELNRQIVSLESNGSVANDLRDTRTQHIQEISELLDTRALERSTGSIDLLVGGHLIVAGSEASELAVAKTAAGLTKVTAGRTNTPATIREGRIAALLRQEQAGMPEIAGRIDQLARNTIIEFNRLHSTGMPRSGPFTTLTSAYGSSDANGNGTPGDELLSQAGFDFEIVDGSVYIGVTNLATNAMERTRIDIAANATTLQDIATELSAIDHLNASIDPTGRLRLSADSGYGFDFSTRLDPNPDGPGTFGGTRPSIGSPSGGPFDLSGQTFPVTFTVTTGTAASPTVTTITLQGSDFAASSAATTDELVAAINDDLGVRGKAMNVGGRLVIQSSQGGRTQQLTLANGSGTVLGDLGLSLASAVGRDTEVSVDIEGTYTGADNDKYVFAPAGDGQIGVTDGLKINVYNQNGALVTELNVGAGYEPGQQLELGSGITVMFGSGTVSQTDGQVFATDVLADSDTSDLLVALGMNAFFLGSGASDIEVDPALLGTPDRLAAGIGRANGDAGNLARLMGLRQRNVADLESNTIEDFYADLVGDVGFETAGAAETLQAQQQLLGYLDAERQSVSGVNIDEEMVSMMQYQQSYEAAARFIAVAQEMTDTLINLGR